MQYRRDETSTRQRDEAQRQLIESAASGELAGDEDSKDAEDDTKADGKSTKPDGAAAAGEGASKVMHLVLRAETVGALEAIEEAIKGTTAIVCTTD